MAQRPIDVPDYDTALARAVAHAEDARSGPGGVEQKQVNATLAVAWASIALSLGGRNHG